MRDDVMIEEQSKMIKQNEDGSYTVLQDVKMDDARIAEWEAKVQEKEALVHQAGYFGKGGGRG